MLHRTVWEAPSTSSKKEVSFKLENVTSNCMGRAVGQFEKGSYRKIPKISTGAYIFQRPCLRGLFLEGLIFGGAYLRREICVSKSIGLAL